MTVGELFMSASLIFISLPKHTYSGPPNPPSKSLVGATSSTLRCHRCQWLVPRLCTRFALRSRRRLPASPCTCSRHCCRHPCTCSLSALLSGCCPLLNTSAYIGPSLGSQMQLELHRHWYAAPLLCGKYTQQHQAVALKHNKEEENQQRQRQPQLGWFQHLLFQSSPGLHRRS